MKVSIIIPVYNGEKYLEECLESVRRQTFRDFQVLVINDGSTDGSREIVERFCREDGRFEVLDVPNGGVSKARNIGIDRSRGEYLTFVDSDDCLYDESLDTFVRVAEETKAQVVVGRFAGGREFKPRNIGRADHSVMDYREAMRLGLYQKIIINSPWGVLIKRELLGDNRRFRENSRYEDLDAFYRFYEGADRIAYIKAPVYFYRDNPESFMHRWSTARLDVLDVTDRMVAFFSERYPELLPAAEDRRFSAHYNMLLLMNRNGVGACDARPRCLRILKEGRLRVLNDPSSRLKNRLGALLLPLFI